jgi:hypothetical protein
MHRLYVAAGLDTLDGPEPAPPPMANTSVASKDLLKAEMLILFKMSLNVMGDPGVGDILAMLFLII